MENSRARSIVDAIMRKSTESTDLSTDLEDELLFDEVDEEDEPEDIKASILAATMEKMRGSKLGIKRD